MPRGIQHEPTDALREQVRSHIAVGTTHETLCKLIGINGDTLAKHYADEIATAKAQANATVAGKLFRTASGQNDQATVADETRAQMFWLKTRAGWRETQLLGNDPDNPLPEMSMSELARRLLVTDASDD